MSKDVTTNGSHSGISNVPSDASIISVHSSTSPFIPASYVDFIAGWCSGAVAVFVCQPFDTLLTRRQAAGVVFNTTASSAAAAAIPSTKTTIIGKEWFSLWRGSITMIGAVPIQNAFLMLGYGLGQQYSELYYHSQHLSSSTTSTSLVHFFYVPIFVGGLVGGIVQSFVMSPIELIKVSQQVWDKTPLSSFYHRNSNNVQRYNPWTQGLHATLWRDGIPHGVWFASYEYAKRFLSHDGTKDPDPNTMQNLPVIHSLLAGSFAATTAWAIGYPFDLIKTRIQSNTYRKELYFDRRPPSLTLLETARDIVKEAKLDRNPKPFVILQAFYQGFTLKLMKAIPASAIGFTVYEYVKKQLTAVQ